ncbi:MAG: polysaccharide export protein EpsE [Cyclobacteriaceae bacterium]|nr:polysaccharide export protein EpsE [Cyclobacteriaceae bacterium]
MKFSTLQFRYIAFLCLFVWGCGTYKQNVLLHAPDDFKSPPITKEILQAERNYVIQKNDMLKVDVYTNKGERVIDPNPELTRPTANTTNQLRPQVNYLVELDGVVKFPVIGDLKMEGLTLRQAELILQQEYDKFFHDCYVVVTFQNKRVIVLGAVGGQVIPLVNQNITLAEVIALAKGLPNDSKAGSIRIVRGEKVFIVDLTTIEGFQSGNMIIEPGDIIYIEPVRRPFAEGLRDYTGLISLFVSALSLIIVIRSLN